MQQDGRGVSGVPGVSGLIQEVLGRRWLRQDSRQEVVQKAGLSMPLGTPECSSGVKL